jgi:hypothetical protein
MLELTPPPLDRFISAPDIRERFETTIKAPGAMVMETAANFDMQSLPAVRAIFWLRDKVMRASPALERNQQGLLAEMQELGWGVLAEEPGRLIVCGAACQSHGLPTPGSGRFRPTASPLTRSPTRSRSPGHWKQMHSGCGHAVRARDACGGHRRRSKEAVPRVLALGALWNR